MKQLDMFGYGAPAAPPRPPEPPRSPYTNFPNAVIRRLGQTLNVARWAERDPWGPVRGPEEVRLFFGQLRELPPERRGDWAERFRRELDRLGLPH